MPIPLVVRNSSASGIRNLYTELDFVDESGAIELKATPFRMSRSKLVVSYDIIHSLGNYFEDDPEQYIGFEPDLQRFDAGKLQRTSFGWRLSFEWEALQPQRIRLVKPVVYAYSPRSTQLTVRARIFADSFPEPIELAAQMNLRVEQSSASLDELLPRWKKVLEKTKDNSRPEGADRSVMAKLPDRSSTNTSSEIHPRRR